jgi:hypothetical protein
MDLGAEICVPSFVKIGLGNQKLVTGFHRQHGDIISVLLFIYFFQNKGRRLIKV